MILAAFAGSVGPTSIPSVKETSLPLYNSKSRLSGYKPKLKQSQCCQPT